MLHTYIHLLLCYCYCYNILTNLTYIQSYIHLYNTYAIVTIALNLIFSARVTSFFVVEDLNHICLFVKHHNLYNLPCSAFFLSSLLSFLKHIDYHARYQNKLKSSEEGGMVHYTSPYYVSSISSELQANRIGPLSSSCSSPLPKPDGSTKISAPRSNLRRKLITIRLPARLSILALPNAYVIGEKMSIFDMAQNVRLDFRFESVRSYFY